MITPYGTRGTVLHGDTESGGLPNGVVEELEKPRRSLVRQDSRGGSSWHELAHDRLIKPILASNREWRLRAGSVVDSNFEGMLAEQARKWIEGNRQSAGLLTGAVLADAKAWLNDPRVAELEVSDAVRGFLGASIEHAKRRRNATLVGIILSAISLLAGVLFLLYMKKNIEFQTALAKSASSEQGAMTGAFQTIERLAQKATADRERQLEALGLWVRAASAPLPPEKQFPDADRLAFADLLTGMDRAKWIRLPFDARYVRTDEALRSAVVGNIDSFEVLDLQTGNARWKGDSHGSMVSLSRGGKFAVAAFADRNSKPALHVWRAADGLLVLLPPDLPALRHAPLDWSASDDSVGLKGAKTLANYETTNWSPSKVLVREGAAPWFTFSPDHAFCLAAVYGPAMNGHPTCALEVIDVEAGKVLSKRRCGSLDSSVAAWTASMVALRVNPFAEIKGDGPVIFDFRRNLIRPVPWPKSATAPSYFAGTVSVLPGDKPSFLFHMPGIEEVIVRAAFPLRVSSDVAASSSYFKIIQSGVAEWTLPTAAREHLVVALRDPRTNSQVAKYDLGLTSARLLMLDVSPDGSIIVFASGNNYLRIFDANHVPARHDTEPLERLIKEACVLLIDAGEDMSDVHQCRL